MTKKAIFLVFICLAAACAEDSGPCAVNEVECAGVCVRPMSDPEHCGACGTMCSTGEVCGAGACGVECPAGQTDCGGACVVTTSDPANCGACGTVCEAGQVCSGSACTMVPDTGCPAGQLLCSDACVDIQIDERHCGGCGMGCGSGELCGSGTCELVCPPGFDICSGECVDTDLDPAHCGACETACTSEQLCNAATCIDLSVGCSAGLTECDAACVDTQTSAQHCGDCGAVCDIPGSFAGCASGGCFFASCRPNFLNLDGDVENGCEVDTMINPFHCGGRGIICGFGRSCSAGVCEDDAVTATTLGLRSVDTTNCAVVNHSSSTGDDRGGIAVGSGRYYYTGDSGETSVAAGDLSDEQQLTQQDSLFSDLRTGTVYSFTVAGSADVDGGNFDGIVVLDPATFDPTGAVIPLSQAIQTTGTSGIFAGLDRVVLVTGDNAYSIALPSGTVTDLGAADIDSGRGCENWAFWGVAETNTDGSTFLVYVSSSSVRRMTLDGRELEEIFGNNTDDDLSDMCSLSIDVARSRFVFHYESGGFAGGSGEVLGYCDAGLVTPPML